MRTKLSAFCDRMIEAGWLAAVALVPTLFSVYTSDRFELHKVALVRSLALLMALAWIIQTVERWPTSDTDGPVASLRRQAARVIVRPLVLPALLVACINLLSTVTSIWPHGSLWGTYDRRQGTITTLSYITIALLLAARLRTHGQMERLARLTVLGSVPVSVCALAQHLNLIPKPFMTQFGTRVSATLGNPIFLAAYLIMVVPITIRQLIRSSRRLFRAGASLPTGLLATATYGTLLVTQLYVVLLTESRGPVLALAVGLCIFSTMWSLKQNARAVWLVVICLVVLATSFLVVTVLSEASFEGVGDLSFLQRLTTIVGARTLKQRVLIWHGAVKLSGESLLRLMVGYGPESLDLAFYGHYPPELVEFEGPGKTADRSHNAILDALISTGLVGATIYLFLICSVLYYGLRALGMAGDGRQTRILAAVLCTGSVVGMSLTWLIGGTRFAAAGSAGGLLVGLVVYLCLFIGGVFERSAGGEHESLLSIACLSAVVAHFVEIQVGIPVTTTRTLFWVSAGVLAARASRQGERWLAPSSAGASDSRPLQETNDCEIMDSNRAHQSAVGGLMEPGVARVVPSALMVGLLLVTTGFGFVTHVSSLVSDPFTIAFLLLVWLWAGLIIVAETSAGAPQENGIPSSRAVRFIDCWFFYIVPSLLSLLMFVPCQILVLRRFPAINQIALVYYVWSFALLVAAGIALLGLTPLPEQFWRGTRAWLYPVLVVVVTGLIVTSGLNLVRADGCFYLGRLYAQANRWDQSVSFYERAVGFAPAQDRYHQFLGHAYLNMAQLHPRERAAWFEESEAALKQAVGISPLNPDHRGNLGNMYHAWADVTDDPSRKAERLSTALAHYRESVSIAPATHGRLLEDAIFEAHVSLAMAYSRLGRIDEALEEAKEARYLAPVGREHDIEQLIERIASLQQP